MISGDQYIGSLKSERMAIFPAMKESISLSMIGTTGETNSGGIRKAGNRVGEVQKFQNNEKINYCSSCCGNHTIAGMAAVKTVSAEASLFERNVEALAGGEGVIGIGRICAYDKWTWCVYLYPYECYDGDFVSDPIVP